jgi:hypothetical protein
MNLKVDGAESFSEAHNGLGDEKILRILWKSEVHYCVLKSPLRDLLRAILIHSISLTSSR